MVNSDHIEREETIMKYRIESNVTREPGSQWFDNVPEQLCARLNLEAYWAGRGGEWGIYDSAGVRVP
jgi:hypothetical protein